MPLTAKGEKIMRAMKAEYGERGEQVFYASKNKGTISGVDRADMSDADFSRLKELLEQFFEEEAEEPEHRDDGAKLADACSKMDDFRTRRKIDDIFRGVCAIHRRLKSRA